jgi:hypothetical protein
MLVYDYADINFILRYLGLIHNSIKEIKHFR